MTINIPEKYLDSFPKEKLWIRRKESEYCDVREYALIHITRWQNHSLLLMSQTERDRLIEKLNNASKIAEGALRLLKAGIITLKCVNGSIEPPDGLTYWLNGAARHYERVSAGLLIR